MENSKIVFDSRIDYRIANPAVFKAALQMPLNRRRTFRRTRGYCPRNDVLRTFETAPFATPVKSMLLNC